MMASKRKVPRFRWMFPVVPFWRLPGEPPSTILDRVAFLATVLSFIFLVGVVSTVLPEERIDERHVDFFVGRYRVSALGMSMASAPVLLLFYPVVRYVASWIWPEADSADEVGEWIAPTPGSKVYETPTGGAVIWMPESVGEKSPLDYTPPSLTLTTTAAEFLDAAPPNPMRALIGADELEDLEFHELKMAWLIVAPEETLRGLLPEAEKRLLCAEKAESVVAYQEYKQIIALDLYEAFDLRGIPCRDELCAFAKRTGNDFLIRMLSEDTAEN